MGSGQSGHFELPRIRSIARHALPRIVEGTVLPVVVFALALDYLGVTGAIVAGLLTSYGVVLRHALGGRGIPGIVVLGAVLITARSVLTLATGSTFVYFLQPTLGTVLVAFAFLCSVPLRKPLAERLARDFCPIPADVLANEHVRRFFLRISLLWAAVQLVNATITVYLLFTESVGSFVVLRSFVSNGLTVLAIAISATWFIRSMRRHGVLAPRVAAPAAQALA